MTSFTFSQEKPSTKGLWEDVIPHTCFFLKKNVVQRGCEKIFLHPPSRLPRSTRFSSIPPPDYLGGIIDPSWIIFGNSANWLQFHTCFGKQKTKDKPLTIKNTSADWYDLHIPTLTSEMTNLISKVKMKGVFPLGVGTEKSDRAYCFVGSWRNPAE